MKSKADRKLLKAVLGPRKKGALQQIEASCAAEADPNGLTPDCSTSTGHVRAGNTLLTHAIHEWSSRVVHKLLECGADPNLEDRNGWTPWMASTMVDESKIERIQESLLQFGAVRDGEHIGSLIRAIYAGDVEQTKKLIKSDKDFKAIANFRVDLVGHQIATKNPQMLGLLLVRNMEPSSTNLANAVRSLNLPAVDLLLRSGLPPEYPGEHETELMTAASLGNLGIVQRLVDAGADVNRNNPANIEWTPTFYANRAGYKEIADWLSERMNPEVREELRKAMEARDPKYQLLYVMATAGDGQSTDDIVAMLQRWDEQYGVKITDVEPDRVIAKFSSVPGDFDKLYEEILEICPDSAEDRQALEKEFAKHGTLLLWWD